MKLTVKLFASARDLVGASAIEVELPAAADVSALRQALTVQYPKLLPLIPSLLISVGTEYANCETRLGLDSEVACFPPVSGG